jgi:predicted metal-dependent phosphoesterase TrpH
VSGAGPGHEAAAPRPEGGAPGSGPGTLRIDLHLHTRGSWDSLSDPERVLAKARARGLDRIAITDHNALEVALDMAARHPDQVIPGEEVKTAEGIDVIGLYLREVIPKGTPMLETCRRIRAQGGIAYLPHPYAAGKGGSGRHAETLAPEVEVIEGWNARLRSAEANRRAQALAERFGKPQGAGSDAHTPGEVGNAWVELPWHPNTPEGLLEALSAPGARVHGERAGLHVFLLSNGAKLWKKLGGGRS